MSIVYIDINILDVKFADRINNLRNSWSYSSENLNKKIIETEKYILSLAKKYNLVAFKILLKQIFAIKMKLNLELPNVCDY